MNHRELSKEIIRLTGGQENITQAWHCITRLRFNVRDEKKVQLEQIRALDGVLGAQFQNDQFQVVIGNKVAAVYEELEDQLKQAGATEREAEPPRSRGLNAVLDTISGIFTPILPAIVGTGMLKGILALLVTLGAIQETSGEYQILASIANAAFYFLPFLLAVSSARKFKVNEYIALTLAGTLLYPTILNAYLENHLEPIRFLSLPVSIVNYTQSVIPIILGVWLLSYVHRWVDRFIPGPVKVIFTSMIVLVITVPILLIAIGPLGNYIGIYLEIGTSWLFAHSGPLTGILLGGLMPVIVMTGMHYAFFPGTLQNLSKLGYDVLLLPLNLVANMSQAGAVMAVFLKTKNKSMKSIALSSGISAFLGITEPAIYGVTLKLKKPFYASIIGGAAGGGFITAVGLKCFGFAVPGLLSLPLYIGPNGGMENFWYALIGVGISFVVSFIVTLLLKWDEPITQQPAGASSSAIAPTTASESAKRSGTTNRSNQEPAPPPVTVHSIEEKKGEIFSPLTGELVSLKELPDPTFAEEMTGKGIAIIPKEGRVTAPFDGTVTMIAKSKHAIMLTSSSGIDILIHVGLNTVSLKGKFFEEKVVIGQRVNKGDLLLEFDIESIQATGIDLTTPVIVANTPDYLDVVPVQVKGVVPMNELLLLTVR
ncbi:PTS system beta-glucoside-specific IIA component, Glc family /PTS system beta-glucoside-specific IIB component, Glc family /PTS system beta-glucoside-specific IIC component, Glc family [Paenibacillus polysaccharolyticus]|uniref:PTS system beta-glucoside-specific IIA component, Glc family /PTS system beta-glucoside-specific IIB component, Glc family /PTS system beta-glucoside-specific IIC component, Glc family n=1 Tax=Paenibacillus polysaccharolyticus TaxID=582692 RepID=A0A1G5CTZ5_9BACL|nr:beta-glucoside-specific PTS transporter subunit IIABC [Paenibacillus polysaccharolyticus]SCY05854.1 PTS system beta-glucoside-specific IIA component, Glc family /PTS system beta-glucoside-specific IIB component, Glc family /PTS system beta-glucoside-specific IIC component, Glc family [Paenibacillus polysaccharolyticus]